MATRLSVTAAALLALACTACGGGSSNDNQASVSWALSGLEPLGAGHVYEGWVIVDGSPVSTGRFNVDAAGVPSATSFALTAAQRDTATAFVLSIEPEPDADPAPSATKILAGDFAGLVAPLAIGHPAALGDDFASVMGGFILATPTTMANMADENQGIWYLDPAGAPDPTLTLPVLPAGWAYEGWVVNAGMPVTTGRFTMAAGVDSDLGGSTAGPDLAPPFPGQDFINPAVSLVGQTAVISVEPEPDDSPAPFAFKPLVAASIGPATAPAVQPMNTNVAASAPTGTATLR